MNKACERVVVVTGSSGYVASDLVPRLRRNHKVVGLDLSPSSNTDFVFDIADREPLFFLRSKNLVD